MADLAVLLDDLTAEGAAVEAAVVDLDDAAWSTATPAPGWTVAHQVAHLAWTDEVALLAVEDEAGFNRIVEQAVADLAATATLVDDMAADGATAPPGELLARWRAGRSNLVAALEQVPPGRKLAWFGPPMSATSMATARLMETWAHGRDVADALGVTIEPTARLRHIAHIGVRTRDFAFVVNGRTPPPVEFRVELAAPDGAVWAWGPEGAPQRVAGTALDFCLLVTQRRHRDDLAIATTGADAESWLGIAQAFAGPPGAGRAPTGRDLSSNPTRSEP